MVGSNPVPGNQEEKAAEFVQSFLEPFLKGSEDYVQEYTPTTATPIITKGEVAVAAKACYCGRVPSESDASRTG